MWCRGHSVVLVALISLPALAQPWQKALEEAKALQQKGSLREAEKAYEALLPDLREADRAALAAALNALSQIQSARGQYEPAMAHAREALDVYRSLGNRTGETRAINNLGVAQLYRGDYGPALEQFQKALALARENGDAEGEIEELNNTGTLYFLQASYLDALRVYLEARAAVDKAGDAPWRARRHRVTLLNLAALFQRLGQDQQALQVYDELRKAPGALPPSEQARLLMNQGVLYRHLTDPRKALQAYEAAERLFQREEHVDGEIRLLKNIGIVQALDLGNLPSALEAFNRALALAQRTGNRRETMQAHLYRGETLYRQGALGEADIDFAAALVLAKELDATDDQWKALYGLGRVARDRGALGVAADRFREAIDRIESVRAKLQLPALKTDFLADKRDVYDALIEMSLANPDAAELFALLERSRARNFQERIARAPPTLGTVQARLDPATVLLELWVGARTAAVLWLTRDGAGVVPLPEIASSPERVEDFVKQASAAATEEWRTESARLGRDVLQRIPPLQRPDARHLLIVPDGPLGELPFELLDLGGTLVIERFDVSYLPSAVVAQREPPSWKATWAFPWKRQLVVFADPVVERAAGGNVVEALAGLEPRGRLPASSEEAHAIASMCRGRAELHLGKANLKSHLLHGGAAGAPLLHLGTHATADTDNPERSRILFSPAAGDVAADYLFLKEVYDLDLKDVDLATLSACDTERGKNVRGEGLQGFSRALLAAGSRAAVTTLWRVGDEPARELMKQFYFELNRGAPKAEALRVAKLRFLRSSTELRHPRYWAAFVLGGDGLHPIPRVVPWSWLLGAAGVVLLAGAVAGGRRMQRRGRADPERRAA